MRLPLFSLVALSDCATPPPTVPPEERLGAAGTALSGVDPEAQDAVTLRHGMAEVCFHAGDREQVAAHARVFPGTTWGAWCGTGLWLNLDEARRAAESASLPQLRQGPLREVGVSR